jgi:tRNA threonylcarbamoyladenosine biosynthesis protein TsaB
MITLAIETSTLKGSTVLADRDEVLAEAVAREGATHSKTLLSNINGLLDQTGLNVRMLDLIAIDVGPGSFTGLRIGLSVAKGLAWAAEKPLVGVTSLDVLARGLPPNPLKICPLIDARKNEVYAALYKYGSEGALERLSEPAVLKPQDLLALIDEETVFLGDGVRVWGQVLSDELGPLFNRAPEDLDFPKAQLTARLAQELFDQGAESDPAMILPFYIRPSEAELLWAAKSEEA